MAPHHEISASMPVDLHGPDPEWQRRYERERAEIVGAIGNHIVRIEHVGSTSIPGIAAKPIVDIAITIPSLEVASSCIAPLQALGYEYVPEYEAELPNRRYFRKRELAERTVHVHMYADGHPEFEEYLLFRDYLRAHPDAARAYEDLKRDLATRLVRSEYTQAKAPFVREMIESARAWRAEG